MYVFLPTTQWHEAIGPGGWPWPPTRAMTSGGAYDEWREREALWTAVKYGRTALGDRAEEQEQEQEQEGEAVDHEKEAAAAAAAAAATAQQQREEEEEDRVLAACARLDDGEEGWLGGGEGSGLLLLAYKAVAAAHLMGPVNG